MSTSFNKGKKRVEAASEINKSLMIVKSQSQNLAAVESFLRNREWKLFSTTSLKDALTYMIQNQPAFVMISVDHPNKKVRNLAKVLNQAFPCCVIMFAEQSAAASFKNLSESKAEYLLYPPVTGPAVERTVNKYYKDQLNKQNSGAEGERNSSFGGAEGDKTINIRGGGNVSTQSLLAQLMGDDEGDGAHQPGFDPTHVGHYNPQTGPGEIAPNHHNGQTGSGEFGPAHHNPQVQTEREKDPNYIPPVSGDEGSSSSFQQNPGSGPGGWAPLEKKEKERPGLPGDDEPSLRTKNHQDSIILRGTREALEKSVVKGGHPEEEKVQTIQDSSNVACIVIESTRFSGYLVAAMGKNRKIDDEFISRIRDKLFKFLTDNGEKVEESKDNMQLKIKQVPFEDWAMECAEFLRKSVHKGDEVAMAFFPNPNVKARFEDSASEDMLAVSLDDLQADAAVEFNLYVYLPANQKYVLYTPRGGKLYANQKEKLSKQGVSHMHMLKHDVQDFNKYRAQNYLNGKIEEFETQQKIKKAAV